MPGSEMLERTARKSEPRRCTTASARDRLVATQKYGSHRSSMSPPPIASATRRPMRRPASSETTGSVGSKSEEM